MSGFICSSNQYKFQGWYFEVHNYCGPTPLNEDGDPTNEEIPAEFWDIWEEFSSLPAKEALRHMVYEGGCRQL